MGEVTATRAYHFEAAHFLPRVPEGHKCKRMHGHNYKFDVAARRCGGGVDEAGFVIDFWDMDAIVQPLIDQVDHRTLNDISGLENPTAENIASWLLAKIRDAAPAAIEITRVRVWEVENGYCTAY